MSTTEASATITGGDLCAVTGITGHQIHNWCKAGVFGPDQLEHPGSGHPRCFGPADVVVTRACRRASAAFEYVNGRGGAPLALLVEVADQVRSGADVVRVRLAEGVELTVDVADLREAS